MKAAIVIVALICLAFFAGRLTSECPKPPDPTTIIEEHEVIRYVDKPVIRKATVTVEKIVERPVYRDACFDDDGLRAVNDLIKGTAAGRPNIRPRPSDNTP